MVAAQDSVFARLTLRLLTSVGEIPIAVRRAKSDTRERGYWIYPKRHVGDETIPLGSTEHTANLSVDPGRFVLLGRSTGAQLALFEAYTGGDESTRVVVSFHDPTDPPYAYAHPMNPKVANIRRLLEDYLGGSPEVREEGYRGASPINFAAPALPSPCSSTTRAMTWCKLHSERLASRLEKLSVPHLLVQLSWATHGLITISMAGWAAEHLRRRGISGRGRRLRRAVAQAEPSSSSRVSSCSTSISSMSLKPFSIWSPLLSATVEAFVVVATAATGKLAGPSHVLRVPPNPPLQ